MSQPTETKDEAEAEMTSGQWKATSFVVTTSNQELNSMCRKKNHSQYHFDSLMWSGGRTQPWMCRIEDFLEH